MSARGKLGHFAIVAAVIVSAASAVPLDPAQVEALDGDTIRVAGVTFRLVGFDAPERVFKRQTIT